VRIPRSRVAAAAEAEKTLAFLEIQLPILREQMESAISKLEDELKKIKEYNGYPKSLLKSRNRLEKYWNINKKLIDKEKINKIFVSNIMLLTDKKLEEIADLFVIYHSKNQ